MSNNVGKTISIFGVNPKNDKQARLFLNLDMAIDLGIDGHAQKIMSDLSKKHGFRILDSVPQSMFDGWDFWIEYETIPVGFPKIFNKNVPWKPVGQA